MLNVPVTIILQVARFVPGTVDEDGLCHCVVYLSNNLIPLKEWEQLRHTAQELLDKYEQELSRVSAGASQTGSSTRPSMGMSFGGKEGAEGSTVLIFEVNP